MDERRLAEIRELDRMGVCQSHETPDMGVAPYVTCDCADEPLEELLAEVDRLTAALAEAEAARERLAERLVASEAGRADLVEALIRSTEAVGWLLEFWPADEDPGPGIRSDLNRWRAALAAQGVVGRGSHERSVSR